jgi:hypothetical protein
MGIYQTICHKTEDLFVKALSRKQDLALIKEKVHNYRIEKENLRLQKRPKK